ncbi:MAG: PQQ-dependent sugar dehydrogenase [Rhodothermales bacterium]
MRPSRSFFRLGVSLAGILLIHAPALAQTPPEPPVITEPSSDGHVVNPFDVHMETQNMVDADGDEHDCTDWEIWSQTPDERVWFTSCIGGLERVHTHFGDGSFEGALFGETELRYDTAYRLRVRFRDSSGLWSDYSERFFQTGSPALIFPIEADGFAENPPPFWSDDFGAPIALPAGATPPALRLEQASGALLLAIRGGASGNEVEIAPELPQHAAVRVVATSGSENLTLPASRLTVTEHDGADRTLYLPDISLAPGQSAAFWVAASGSTYLADPGEETPDFSDLARGAPIAWSVMVPGFNIVPVATGFRLPVNVAFVPNPGTAPDAPYFYVSELYGSIKVVSRDGTVSDFATDLLNYTPSGLFPGSGEQGLAGIVIDPANGDLLAGVLYDPNPRSGTQFPKVIRLASADGGRTASTITTVLDMPDERQGQSHFISTLTIGPDGKLYVNMGDGFRAETALDLTSFRGKILRVNLDGSAPADNPFYDASDGITATDYIYAYGLRNPFGGRWRTSDGALYTVENGGDANDRFARIEAGQSYGWNGNDQTLTTGALYNWTPPHAPVNIAFIEPETYAGSGFPEAYFGDAFVTESGATWASGPQDNGKRIVRFDLDAAGALFGGPQTIAEYTGSGKASAAALTAGRDGLYFSDLYKDFSADPTASGANILRLQYAGDADFSADVTSGDAPLTVRFTEASTVPGASAWQWDFGDGGESGVQHPTHTFSSEGLYTVRLRVTGERGVAIAEKTGFILVGGTLSGVQGVYYNGPDFTGFSITRIDPTIDFDWGDGPPVDGMRPDNFSVRWTGQVAADVSGTYTFSTLTDDGVRLWVDDVLLIDNWLDQEPTRFDAAIDLEAGRRYNLKMEYYEHGGEAVARLLWTPPGGSEAPIPSDRLYPATGVTVSEEAPVPEAGLEAPFPNPFANETTVRFAVDAEGPVALTLYNMLGQSVMRLFEERAAPGRIYELRVDASGLAGGVYVLHLRAAGRQYTRKLVHVPD